jgi:hypothetical protein
VLASALTLASVGAWGRDEALARSVREAGVGELAQLSATLADAFATDPILQWLAPRQRSDRRLRQLIEIELAHYVFPAGRVLTTGDFRGANLELPPGRWEMSVPLSAAIGFVRVFGLRLPRGDATTETFREQPPPRAALLHSLPGCGHTLPGSGPRHGVAASHVRPVR